MADLRVEATAGGGMVTVVVNGAKQLQSIRIDPEVVSKDDVEMLQDLIVAAVNDAHRKVDEQLGQSMSGMLGGLKIPDSETACRSPILSSSSSSSFQLPVHRRQGRPRLAFHVLRTPREDADRLCDAIRDVKDRVTYCSTCNNITDTDPCASAPAPRATSG